jgi:hypothetical protein
MNAGNVEEVFVGFTHSLISLSGQQERLQAKKVQGKWLADVRAERSARAKVELNKLR